MSRNILLLIGVILLTTGIAFLIGNPGDFSRHRYVEGQVLKVGSRYKKNRLEGEDYALYLSLSDNSDPEILKRGNQTIVVCTDAQCSALSPGDNVGLNCAVVEHINAPPDIVCSFTKVLSD